MSDLILSRRKVIAGIGALFAAPAIIKAERLMRLPSRPKLIRSVSYIDLTGMMPAPVNITLTATGYGGPWPLLRHGRLPLRAGDVVAGKIATVEFSGDHWELA